jgi:hypothetical protein
LIDPNPPLKKKKAEITDGKEKDKGSTSTAIVVKPKKEKNNQVVPV